MARGVAGLPSGTLTIMFTDIEGSVTHWESTPDAMRAAMVDHDALLAQGVAAHGGVVFKHTGDGIGAVFTSPDQGALAAVEIQRSLQAHDWSGLDRLRVRIGLHIGDITPDAGLYLGAPVNRAARVADIANGDQITVSGQVADRLEAVSTRPMGPHQLKGIGTETIDLVLAPGLIVDDRPLRARVSRAVKPLPASTNRLIGRRAELAQIHDWVSGSADTITIVGMGGIGKTHLAIEAARAVSDRFVDGVTLCNLDALDDDTAVLDAIAETIGARVQPEMSLLESIGNFVEGRDLLLVLDECEHVIDAVRDFVDHMAGSGLRLIVTSRERLGIGNEQVLALGPLPAGTTGTELFVERARDRDFSFEPTPAEIEAIERICSRVDGIPLGIELAAAWVRVLTPDRLLDRLDDRFGMLEQTPSRSGRTLRETAQWSYDQLDENQKHLLERLSVFAGGFSIDAVEAICVEDPPGRPAGNAFDTNTVLRTMMSLVDKSMVTSVAAAGQIRFSMLGTLRQLGRERLQERGETDWMTRRHADYFSGLARGAAAELVSEREADIWDQLDADWANIRAGFNALRDRDDPTDAIALVLDLGWFAGMSMRSELFVWVDELAQLDDLEARPEAASILGLLAIYEYLAVDDGCVATARRGLELDTADPHGYCRATLCAVALNNRHDAAESEERTQVWLDSLDDRSPMMSRLWALGMRVFHLCVHHRSVDEATELHARMLAIAERSGSASAAALTQWAGGMVATYESIDAGMAEWRVGLDRVASVSDVHLLHHLIVGLELHFTAARGDIDEVLERCHQFLELAHDQHYLAGTSHLFGVTAIVLSRVGSAEVGAELLGAMIGNGHLPRRNATGAVESSLGPRTEQCMARGRDLSINDAATLALGALRSAIEARSTQPFS